MIRLTRGKLLAIASGGGSLPCRLVVTFDFQAHAAGRAGDHPHRVLQVAGVEVGHLRLGDLFELGLGHRAHLILVRHGRTFGQADRLLQQHGRRRALGDEVERTVVVDGHHDRDHHPAGFLRPIVELLDELAQVDAVLAERSADRRRGRGLPAGDLKLRHADQLFCHDS